MIDQNAPNIDSKEMQKIIEMIRSFDVTESYYSYPFIKNALNEIHFHVPKCVIPRCARLVRGRVHKNKEEFFHKVSDISYNKQTFLIPDFGRANEPGQSIFYCSDNQNTAFNETCSMAKEDLDKDSELITWGVWEVTKDIEISYVIGSPTQVNENETLKYLTQCFVEFLREMPEENKRSLLLFHNFISTQFQLKANGHHSFYKISCAYSNWIYEHFFIDKNRTNIECAGIMYRSSIWPKEGMNIALISDIVDKSLRLIDVRRDHIVKQGNDYNGFETKTAHSIDMNNDTIFWT